MKVSTTNRTTDTYFVLCASRIAMAAKPAGIATWFLSDLRQDTTNERSA
jgi:hypothetical protein